MARDAKALAATMAGGGLPPGAGLSLLGDDGLGMMSNSPDVLKVKIKQMMYLMVLLLLKQLLLLLMQDRKKHKNYLS